MKNSGLAEPVEALSFFFQERKEGGFDKLSQAGFWVLGQAYLVKPNG